MKCELLDRDIAQDMIADLDEDAPDSVSYDRSRIAQQFRYALVEIDRRDARIAELEAPRAADEEFQAKIQRVAREVLEDELHQIDLVRFVSASFVPQSIASLVLDEVLRGDKLDQIAEHIAARVSRETM